MKGQSLTGLGGMLPVSIVNKVLIWRPLLAFEKTSIFDYAHEHGTPYFKDSTPDWSTRGKLRNNLLPTLEDMYGKGVHANLTKLARQSKELLELVQVAIFNPFLEQGKCVFLLFETTFKCHLFRFLSVISTSQLALCDCGCVSNDPSTCVLLEGSFKTNVPFPTYRSCARQGFIRARCQVKRGVGPRSGGQSVSNAPKGRKSGSKKPKKDQTSEGRLVALEARF